jgi:hypothetical protein
LQGGQFRWLNEKLYTTTGAEALELFRGDAELFETYHAGFRAQVSKWPEVPLDLVARRISRYPKDWTIADLGCGEGGLKDKVVQAWKGFDLVAAREDIVACDIARLPLPAASVHCCVFCLALMGTNLMDFLTEADRILKPHGALLVAEVRSRIDGASATPSDSAPARAAPTPHPSTASSSAAAAAAGGAKRFGVEGDLAKMHPPASAALGRFVRAILSLRGSRYRLRWSYNENPYFVMLEFSKESAVATSATLPAPPASSTSSAPRSSPSGPVLPPAAALLKPCVYKKR